MNSLCLASTLVRSVMSTPLEMALEPRQPRLPPRGHRRDPLRRRVEALGLDAIAHLSAVAALRNDPRVLEDPEMLHDGLARHRQARGELGRGRRTDRQPLHELASCRVAKRGERVHLHVQPDSGVIPLTKGVRLATVHPWTSSDAIWAWLRESGR